jgi:glycosyltransferase involved in cell wall biosynthesis
MRILIFNWRDIKHPEAGGAEIHLHEIFKRIATEHEVVLVSSKFAGGNKVEIIDGIKVIRVGNKFLFNYAAFWYFMRKLRREKFDVIVDDISKVPLFTPLYTKKPLVAIDHHLHGRILFKELPPPLATYIYLLEKLMPMFYKKIPFVVVSRSTKEELMAKGIPEQKITIVYNGINPNSYAPGTKSAKPQVIYFGRVKKYKQIDQLVKAFCKVRKKIAGAELIVAGKGDYKELERLVRKLGLKSSVKLIGEVNDREKVKMLQRAWVFVTPSMKEGWAISVIEANACGTPAIAYNVPGLRDSINDGETGLLVPYSNIEELANAIVSILTDSELRQRLSSGALQWASNFSWDRSAAAFMDILPRVT